MFFVLIAVKMLMTECLQSFLLIEPLTIFPKQFMAPQSARHEILIVAHIDLYSLH